jgi:hypothetical protein
VSYDARHRLDREKRLLKRLTWSLALVITNLLGIAVVLAMIERQKIDALVLVPVTLVLFLLILWVKKQHVERDHDSQPTVSERWRV